MKPTTPTDKKFTDFHDLVAMAELWGFKVTSTNSGPHNNQSAHFKGLAIDVRTRGMTEHQISLIKEDCHRYNIWAYDERIKPAGQKIWTGPHLHLEIIQAK